jgi:flagellar basal-body rod protein FlgC
VPNPVLFPQVPRPLRNLMSPLSAPAAGMAIEQKFLEVIASNIANVETTKTPEGGAYKRQVAVAERDATTGRLATRVVEDSQPGRKVYDPGHPDADSDGFVTYPNVDLNTEIVDLMIARRIHEANATVFQAAKSMLKRALDI